MVYGSMKPLVLQFRAKDILISRFNRSYSVMDYN